MNTLFKKYRWWLIGLAVIVILFFVAKHYYEKAQNAEADKNIEIIKSKQSATQKQIKIKGAEIEKSNADFLNAQDQRTDQAKNIQKTTKYEKPIIKSADYSAMLDSLSSAMPD